jgi:uncharacterized membrane protein YgcG
MRPLLALLVYAPVLLAAPVPAADDKPKPRAKLLGTLTVAAEVREVSWTPDGKHLVLVADKRVLVYPRDQIGAEKPVPLTAFDRPTGPGSVRLTADGGLWVLETAGQKVNAENRLHVWSAKTLLAGGEPKADRVIDLEVDNPIGVVVSADGASVYATLVTTRVTPNADPNVRRRQSYEYVPTFVRLSGKTGDTLKKVPLADLSEERYGGSTFDPRTGRLYLATHTEGETTVSCREADGGKRVWERKLQVKPDQDSIGEFLLSPDGSRVVYRQPTLTVLEQGGGGGWGAGGGAPGGGAPGGGFAPGGRGGAGGGRPQAVSYMSSSTLVTLDAATGVLGEELTKATVSGSAAYSLSADGRLLFAYLQTGEGSKLAVWDTKSGAEVKGWARGNVDVSGAFAPTAPLLAVVERERKEVLGQSVAVPGNFTGQGQQWSTRQEVIRTEYTSVVGLWDLTPVVK